MINILPKLTNLYPALLLINNLEISKLKDTVLLLSIYFNRCSYFFSIICSFRPSKYSLPHVSTCLKEHFIVQCFVRKNIFTLPNIEPSALQLDFISSKRQWIKTVDEDSGWRQWMKTVDEDSGWRQWMKTVDEDSGRRQWMKTVDEDSTVQSVQSIKRTRSQCWNNISGCTFISLN